jgi:pilus assembly protein Flp/PilA
VKYLTKILLADDGQGMTEYGLIIGVFVLAVIGAFMMLGPKVAGLFSNTNNSFI